MDHATSAPVRCPRCGAPPGDGLLRGLCPACLARKYFASEEDHTPASLPPSLASLGRFGDYELEEEIARGGMGVVYRARQLGLGRPVAVKLLRDGVLAGAQEVRRFRAEAQTVAALAHPNIVGIHEIGEHEGQLFLVMPLIAGQDLAALTRDGPLPARRAAEWLVRIADAVQHAHDRGVLHRDLKPSNILVDADGVPHVTDFGLARHKDRDGGLTLSGQVLGTPGYLAPEQAAGRRDLTAVCDVYGLGALLYHLLTGRAPFVGESPAAVLRQVEERDPVPPRVLNPSVPRDLDTLTLKALAKDPSARYGTARAMREDLERFLRGEPLHARPVSGLERAGRWARRHPAPAALATLVVLLGLSVAGVLVTANLRLSAQRAQGEQVKRFLTELLAAPDPNKDGREVRVVDVLARASRRAEAELAGQPLVLAEVQDTLGVTYYQLALYAEGEPLLRSALRLFERELGPAAVRTAETRAHLGALLHWAGRAGEGVAELEAAVAALRRHQPRARASLAAALQELASAHIGRGRAADARPFLQECIELCRLLGPEQDPIRAAALSDLSAGLWEAGDPGWRAALEESITLNRRLPDGRMNLATSLSNLADGLIEEEALEEAEAAARESLALRRELFGPDSSPVAFAHARLGTVLLARSNLTAALEEALRARAVLEADPAPSPRDLQFVLRLQGRVLNSLGRPAEAEPVLRLAHAHAVRAVGPDHTVTHGIACQLAESLADQGRANEARPLLAAALPVLRRELAGQIRGRLQQRRLREFEALYERLQAAPAVP